MWRRLTLCSILVVVPLAACGGSSTPAGPLVDVANVAKTTQPADYAFETFVGDLKLQPDVVAQLKASRAAVTAKLKPVHLTSFAAREGVRVGQEAAILMPLLFGSTLADALDPVTAGRGGGSIPDQTLNSTVDSGTTTTTTTLTTNMQLSGSGSRVTLSMHWTYHETTREKATGTVVVDMQDDRTMSGTIDVCPDNAGISPANLQVRIQMSATHGGSSSTRSSTSGNDFSGHVDDQAVLRRVTEDVQQQVSWEGSSGTGGFQLNGQGYSWQAGSNGVTGGLDASGISGTLNGSGSASADQVRRGSGWTMALDWAAIKDSYTQAQRLWRNGRCIVIQTPDYNAETPLEVASQEKVQHDEEVDPDSQTKFAVSLKHRFGATVRQPVKASLSGDKKLEPTTLDSGSGSLTYTAPGEDEKQGTVTLKSISKRGIGTLVVQFHTKGKHLKLSARGTLVVNFSGVLNLAWNLTINPADFHRAGNDTWEAQATAKASGRYTNLPINCPIQFTETANITLVATRDTRGGQSVWVVKLDQLRSSGHDVGAPCIGGSYAAQFPSSGYVVLSLLAIGDIVVPADGGTIVVSGTRTDAGGATHNAKLTFTATVTEE